MNNQLMAKLRSRQIASGVQEEQHTKPTVHKTEIQKPSDFSQKRKNLQAFFAKQGGGSSVQEVPIKKQEIKGNTQGFNNARKLLQQNGLGGGIGGSSLPPPPPPSLNGLPPPPPPPPGNLPPPPPPPSGILPPPPIPSGNLPPPPPPLSGNILPPPPSLSGNIPPPPPPKNFSSPSNKSYNSPSRSSNHPQQHPKPQQNNIAQSSSQKVHERPPPPPPPSHQEHVTHQRVSQKVSQPPQHNLPPPPNNSIDNPYSNNSSTHGNSHLKVPKQEPRISQKGQKKVKHPRTPIFSGNNTKQNITGQFFGKDLAGLVKRQFIRNSQILPIITSKVEKKVYNFNFPSIQNHIREVEPIETLYADNLDVVSCYLQKNLNAIKPHQQSRRNLINGLKTYDWSKDSLKIKQIQQIPQSVQSIKYEEPNLVQIKNCLNRCDTLINIYKKHENYEACAEIKKTKEQLDKLISRYCKEPQGNQAILDRIDTIVQKIKTANI